MDANDIKPGDIVTYRAWYNHKPAIRKFAVRAIGPITERGSVFLFGYRINKQGVLYSLGNGGQATIFVLAGKITDIKHQED